MRFSCYPDGMNIPWIDIFIGLAAAFGGYMGRKRGFGRELWRILRRLFPAIFGFGLYRAMGAMLVKLPGIGQGAARFWGFILIFSAVMILMHKGRSRVRTWLINWGQNRPDSWGMAAGVFRSLMTSALVLFLLSMIPIEPLRNAVMDSSWLAPLLQRLQS
jgi:uncharacterized membrane protein required for colicin V production